MGMADTSRVMMPPPMRDGDASARVGAAGPGRRSIRRNSGGPGPGAFGGAVDGALEPNTAPLAG